MGCTTAGHRANGELVPQRVDGRRLARTGTPRQLPTLVFHGDNDWRVPYIKGREIHALVPGSKMPTVVVGPRHALPELPLQRRFEQCVHVRSAGELRRDRSMDYAATLDSEHLAGRAGRNARTRALPAVETTARRRRTAHCAGAGQRWVGAVKPHTGSSASTHRRWLTQRSAAAATAPGCEVHSAGRPDGPSLRSRTAAQVGMYALDLSFLCRPLADRLSFCFGRFNMAILAASTDRWPTLLPCTFVYAIGFVGNCRCCPRPSTAVPPRRWSKRWPSISRYWALCRTATSWRGVASSVGDKSDSESMERSTFVLAATTALALLMWQWRPIAEPVLWSVTDPVAASSCMACSGSAGACS